MHEAKTGLSKLVEAVESGRESEIIIARNGKPVARIVPLAIETVLPRRLGLHDGEFGDFSLEEWNAMDDEIVRAMIESPLFPGEDKQKEQRRKKSA
jgi:prevent-host-death family protein